MAKTFNVDERTSAEYSATVKDEAGVALTAPEMTSIKATLYSVDSDTDAIVNSRNQQDVLGENGGALSAGTFTLSLTPSDNVVLNPQLSRERHILLLEFLWDTGSKGLTHQVNIVTKNLRKVT